MHQPPSVNHSVYILLCVYDNPPCALRSILKRV